MFSLTGDLSEDEEDLDFRSVSGKNSSGLTSLFGQSQGQHNSANNSKLVYQAPKQPSGRPEMRNVEIVQTDEVRREERLDVMSNVSSGVKMATAVSAYRYEGGGYESLGKLGLAIIGKKESSCYQLLLYRGKQSAVAVANISPRFVLRIQQDNYANFTDEAGKSWTVCFDSQDVMINFTKQTTLCKAMFSGGENITCDLLPGDGRGVELGDSLEVQVTQWTVDHQSLGRMLETTRNKDKGMRFKLGGRNFFSGLESGIVGMKKGGRRFIIAPSEEGRKAFDVEITKVKAEQDKKVADVPGESQLRDRVARLGQPVILRPKVPDTPLDMPELEDVSDVTTDVTTPKSAFSTPRLTRRRSVQEGVRTPIPIIRSDSPQSVRSGQSSSGHFRPVVTQQTAGFYSQGSEFNMLMSETRMQNTEMRMNIQRISDKMDNLAQHQPNKQGAVSNEDIMAKLEQVLAQSRDIKTLAERRPGPGEERGQLAKAEEEERLLGKQQKLKDQAEMLRRLEANLKEKEEQLEEVVRGQQETISLLERKLEEQILLTDSVQAGARSQLHSEVKKLMSSTAKLLVSQYSSEEVYSGHTVRDTVARTFQLIGDRLAEKYKEPPHPPVAAVAPVPAEVEDWEAEDDQ